MRPEQAAPADFTRTVTGAIRRRRWEYDQHVDRAFNVAIALGVTLIVVAVVSLLNVAALAQMLMAAADAVAELPNQSPSWGQIHTVPMATIAITVVGTGIAVWWWAERPPRLPSALAAISRRCAVPSDGRSCRKRRSARAQRLG